MSNSTKCPMCGGRMPIAQHSSAEWGWKHGSTNLCSYTCMRAMERKKPLLDRVDGYEKMLIRKREKERRRYWAEKAAREKGRA